MPARDLLGILFVTATWGIGFVAVKGVIVGMPTMTSAGLRFALAGALLLLVARALGRGGAASRRAWTGALVIGLLQTTGLYGLVYLSLHYESTSATAILMNLTPVFAIALGAPLLGERVGRLAFVGLAVALVGVSLVSSGRHGGSPLGLAFVVTAALSWGLATVMTKRLMVGDPLPLAGRQMLLGSLPLLAAGAFERQDYHLTAGVVLWFAFGALVAGVAVFAVWYWLIERHAAALLSSFMFLNPIFGVIAGALIVGEPLHARFLVGAVLVLLGVWLCQRGAVRLEPVAVAVPAVARRASPATPQVRS